MNSKVKLLRKLGEKLEDLVTVEEKHIHLEWSKNSDQNFDLVNNRDKGELEIILKP